jgi:hypothetical protein
MSLSATAAIQGAPNAVPRMTTPTVATTHDDFESTRRTAGSCMYEYPAAILVPGETAET